MEKTLILIKPDAVKRNLIGEILRRFESRGLSVAAMKLLRLSKEEAQGFYHVHAQRPFFDSLTAFMASGPIAAVVLTGEGEIITKVRDIMGATNPEDAAEGTIRKDLAVSLEENSVHGSDSPESAATEIPYFFSELELNK